MFKILLIGMALLFFIGAVRRWFFAGGWRSIVPLVVGCLIGVPLSAKVVGYGAPPEVKFIVPIFAVLIIAAGLRGVLDEISKGK